MSPHSGFFKATDTRHRFIVHFNQICKGTKEHTFKSIFIWQNLVLTIFQSCHVSNLDPENKDGNKFFLVFWEKGPFFGKKAPETSKVNIRTYRVAHKETIYQL